MKINYTYLIAATVAATLLVLLPYQIYKARSRHQATLENLPDHVHDNECCSCH